MKIIKIDPNNVDPEVVELAVQILKNGGVVVHPTDTCYGFATDVFSPEAVTRLQQLKRMDGSKPISVIVSGSHVVNKYVEINNQAQSLMENYWPGPLTLVLPRRSALPKFYNPKHDTVGVRHPKCLYSLALVNAFGNLITTTSANISGQESPYSLYDILRQFAASELKPDLILDAGQLPRNKPSTIIEIKDGQLKVIREGSLASQLFRKRRGCFDVETRHCLVSTKKMEL